MKKILLCLLTIFLLSACTSKSKTVELNHEQLLKGDFSSIAGEYENPSGETVVINDEGLREGERAVGEVIYSGSIYYRNTFPEGAVDGGYAFVIYPVGFEIEDLDTDTSKVRISYGQAQPMSEEEIYTKK